MFASVIAASALAAFQTPRRAIECQVIDALFIQQTASLPKIDPRYVRPPGHFGQLRPRTPPSSMARFMPTLAASLDVPDEAVKELTSVVLMTSQSPAWTPDCAWSTPPTGMVNAFSRPVMTKDSRLAVFEWDTGIDDPPGNLGRVCLAHRPQKAWKVNCIITWER